MVGEKDYFHVAAGLIWNNGKLLITRRPKGVHLEGLWEFPGGKQEAGESLEDCLDREINEELGLKIRVDAALLTVEHEYTTRFISLHVYQCTWIGGEPKALEGQQIRWVSPEDLKGYHFPPPDKKVIEFLTR